MGKIFLRGSAPYLDLIRPADGRLDYLNLVLPFQCDNQCLICCNRSRRTVKRTATSRKLTIHEWENVISEAAACGARVMTIMGEGEPFLDENIARIIEFACQQGLIPYIFTNGLSLDDNRISRLHDYGASLIFDVPSLEEAAYHQMTRSRAPEAFNCLMNVLEQCARVFTDTAEQQGEAAIVSLAINTVVTKLNIDCAAAVQAWCADRNVVFVCNEPIDIGNANKYAGILYGTMDDRAAIRQIVEHFAAAHGPLGSITVRGQRRCMYMWRGLTVNYDGTVLLCPYATDLPHGLIGNVRDGGLVRYLGKDGLPGMPMEKVLAFFERCGDSRCLLRHPSYHDIVTTIQP